MADMTLYITRQRRLVLRALLDATTPLSTRHIVEHTQVCRDTVSITLRRFEAHGWVTGTPGPTRRQGVTRFYALAEHARSYVEILIEEGEA